MKFDLLNKKVFSFFFLFALLISPYSKLLANSQIKNDEEVYIETILDKNFYIIGPGDTILLNIYSNKEFSGLYKVLPDGNVSLPLIGNIKIQNLSLDQAITLLEEEYSKQLIRPELNISVKDERPIKVSLIGEVKRPGIYALSKLESLGLNKEQIVRASNNPTIFDAIQKAGGITQKANLTKVKIIRKQPGDQEYKYAFVNLVDLILKGDFSQNPYLLDGDVIELSSGVKSSLTESNMNITSTNLSPQKFKISVIGMVNRPGVFEVDSSITLSQAILLAGGPVFQKASFSNVDLIRINRNGSANMSKYTVNLNKDYFQFNFMPIKKAIINGIQGWLTIVPFVLLISLVMNNLIDNQNGSNPLLEIVLNNNNYFSFILLFVTTTIIAPLFEETIFRGVLLPTLSRDFGIIVGIIVSAFIFALAHLSLGEMPPLFVLGIGLGITRIASGSLLSSVIMHSLWNGLTFLNLFLLRT